MSLSFDTVAQSGICDVCGKETQVAVCCSTFGAQSFAYCQDCLVKGLEPYSAMVNYIASAGHYPDDINSIFVEEVRNILKHLGKSEEEFAKDVRDSILQEIEDIRSMKNETN